MVGENDKGLSAFNEAGGHSNAEVQYAAGLSAIDPQAGVNSLAKVGLAKNDFARVLIGLSTQTGVDPYPALRVLARQANDQLETWVLWLEGSSRLEAANEWQAALDWINEGLGIAPTEVYGSLYLRVGRIWQTKADPRDYQAALRFIDRALEEGGWINPSDEYIAHLYRGDIYLSLNDEFSLDLVLEEFNTVLKLQPGNYYALLNIGYVYLYDLKDIDQADSYFQQAISSDDKSPYAYYYLGEVYLAKGDKETAIDWYQQALEQRP